MLYYFHLTNAKENIFRFRKNTGAIHKYNDCFFHGKINNENSSCNVHFHEIFPENNYSKK